MSLPRKPRGATHLCHVITIVSPNPRSKVIRQVQRSLPLSASLVRSWIWAKAKDGIMLEGRRSVVRVNAEYYRAIVTSISVGKLLVHSIHI